MTLLLGDCLDLLPALRSESIDLVYLDPPFFTQREHVGTAGTFSDQWANVDEYVRWMKDRLYALHRVLALTGTLYLHCDEHAVNELKIALDGIFGVQRYQADIVWKRSAGSKAKRQYGRCKDRILCYSKGPTWTWNEPAEGAARSNLWDDIPPLNPRAKERTGWPTQKPEALLRRIIEASSDPGDLVLDPFCGSGTTLAAAESLGRRWIGMDASAEALTVAARRLGIDSAVAA